MNKKILFWETIILSVIGMALAISRVFHLDPDFGWHVFVGSSIYQNGKIATNQIGYNYFSNLTFSDHEWLSNLLFYLGYKTGGYNLMAAIATLLIIILVLFSSKLARIYSKNKASIFLSVIVFIISIYNVVGIRPQMTILIGVALIFLINKYQKNIAKRGFFYCALILIVNNLHGGFIFYSPILFLLELSSWHKSEKSNKTNQKYILLFIFCLLSFLIIPNIQSYFHLIKEYFADSSYKKYILEWLPIYSLPLQYEMLFALSVIIFIFTINQYYKKIPKIELFLLLVYGFLGIQTRRNFPIFILISLPYLTAAFDDFFILTKANKKKTFIVSMALLSILLLTILKNTNFENIGKDPLYDNQNYPKQSLEFISNTTYTGNLLNPYGWGGYVLGTHPEIKIFIDGRVPQAKIGDRSLVEVYNLFFDDKPETIQDNLTKYDIGLVWIDKASGHLAKTDSFLANKLLGVDLSKIQKNNLKGYLSQNSEWENVYEDDLAIVYKKTNR